MKRRHLGIIILALSSSIAWADEVWPQVENISVQRAYIPIGFDENNLSQVVVTGTLPSSCQLEGPSQVKVDTVAMTIIIQQQTYAYPGHCIRAKLPFMKTVDIGLLPVGVYSVRDAMTGAVLGSLPVTKASVETGPGPYIDDDPYALVDDAFILTEEGSAAGPMLYIDAKLPDDCL